MGSPVSVPCQGKQFSETRRGAGILGQTQEPPSLGLGTGVAPGAVSLRHPWGCPLPRLQADRALGPHWAQSSNLGPLLGGEKGLRICGARRETKLGVLAPFNWGFSCFEVSWLWAQTPVLVLVLMFDLEPDQQLTLRKGSQLKPGSVPNTRHAAPNRELILRGQVSRPGGTRGQRRDSNPGSSRSVTRYMGLQTCRGTVVAPRTVI